ncbi:MAG: glycosyltransferase family 2 protein, partial [Candidatus Binatia bacterium]
RASALKEMGGLPAHDAEDLLITLLYRARGWQGIYLPEILARGLTPVDWSGYLVQQRRWARSVLDLKWRIYPAQFRHLPLRTRLITFGHGLNYVFKSLIVLSLLLAVGSMLALGTPRGLFSADSGSKALMLCSALLLCEFYRQRFYLDPPNEVGLHWRAVILQMAKWPYHLCAIGDVLFGRREAYALTRKVKPKDRPYLLLSPHLAVVAFLGIAWMIGVLFGSVVDLPLQAIAFLIIAGSLLLILTERWEYPPPYTGTPRVMARRGVDRLPIRADL